MLVSSLDQLRALLAPIFDGAVAEAAFDTETTEILDDRFTPYGTDSRIAGFSISYNGPTDSVDFYVPIRHKPYPWLKRADLLRAKHPDLFTMLTCVEGVDPAGGWKPGMDPNLPLEETLEILRQAFSVARMEAWWGHNWLFDAKMLDADEIQVPWHRLQDTQVWSVMTDERPLDRWDDSLNGGKGGWFHGGHGLKHLGETYLGAKPDAEAALKEAREKLGTNDYSALPLRALLAPYAWQDTRLTLDLSHHMRSRRLAADPEIRELIRKHHAELPFVMEMEKDGVAVDLVAAKAGETRANERMAEIAAALYLKLGRALNLSSPDALKAELYGAMELPRYRDKDDTEAATLKQIRSQLVAGSAHVGSTSWATDDQAISTLDAILDFREAQKDQSAFFSPLLEFGKSGTIHTTLSPVRARTLRFSAGKPNVQQARSVDADMTPEEKAICVRALFVPRPEMALCALDYDGQELRTAAHFALAVPDAFEYRFTWRCTLKKRGDCKGKAPHGPDAVHVSWRSDWAQKPRVGLAEGYLSGDPSYDPHRRMVERCAELNLQGIDRRKAKAGNFLMIYGGWIYKLMETLDCSFETASKMHRAFWDEVYPELGHAKAFIGERLRRHGPATHWSGARSLRTLHGGQVFLDGAHKGLNYVVQRSCREMLLQAIIDVGGWLQEERPDWRIVFPVHDELVLEAPRSELFGGGGQATVREIARRMVRAGRASRVPMAVNASLSESSWAHMEKAPGWGWNGVIDGVS